MARSFEQEDFDIEFGGQVSPNRELVDGRYIVEVRAVRRTVVRSGKFEGVPSLEWRLRIKEGDLSGLEFIASSILTGEMGWTTDKILIALFPAIQRGQKPSVKECIGRHFEIGIKTRKNKETGQTSMYVDTHFVAPAPEPGSTGELGDLGTKSEDIPF